VLIGIPGTIVLSFEEFHLSNKNIFLILCCTVFLSMSLSFLTLLFDLWIDTSHPKLNWETPTVALKQNLNSIFSILLNIGIIIILMVFSFLVLKKTLTSLFFLSCAIFLVDVLLWRIFVRRAEKKLALLEI
jgi:ABC-type transport system involved in Fe-S cluster assembly fused permease/ATPase subunit